MGGKGEGSGLRRVLGSRALLLYGVGGMLGGGIYALVGEVGTLAGSWAWLSFLLAMAVAAPTALTYAELAARHPRSGGEASYARAAFGGRTLPFLVGWLVLFSGVVSMAALSRAFAGYLAELAPGTPAWAAVPAFLGGLAALNLRGIRITSVANVVCTLVETAGLVLVIAVGATFLAGGGGTGAEEPAGVAPGASWTAVLSGSALAFYAFIGFEDMVNVAEEVRAPGRAYPRTIPAALVIVGSVYAAVAFVATAVLTPAELADSTAPLTDVVAAGAAWIPPRAYSVVALFAVANTALLNFVMASRLAYGMAREELLPGWLDAVHARWRTPHRAIAVVLAVAVALAVSGGIAVLAGTTSLLLLAVFFAMNLALLRLRRAGDAWTGFRAPRPLPVVGLVLCAGLAVFLPGRSLLTSLAVAALSLPFLRLARGRS